MTLRKTYTGKARYYARRGTTEAREIREGIQNDYHDWLQKRAVALSAFVSVYRMIAHSIDINARAAELERTGAVD